MKIDTDDPIYREKLKVTLGLSYDQGALSIIDLVMEHSAKGMPIKQIMDGLLDLRKQIKSKDDVKEFERKYR